MVLCKNVYTLICPFGGALGNPLTWCHGAQNDNDRPFVRPPSHEHYQRARKPFVSHLRVHITHTIQRPAYDAAHGMRVRVIIFSSSYIFRCVGFSCVCNFFVDSTL